MRITIDRDQCISCGACYQECPKIYEENTDDNWTQIAEAYRVDGSIAVGEVPADIEACAKAGAEVCPVSIIHVG